MNTFYLVLFFIGGFLLGLLAHPKKSSNLQCLNIDEENPKEKNYDCEGVDFHYECDGDNCYNNLRDHDNNGRFYRINHEDMPDGWGEIFGLLIDRQTRVQYLQDSKGYATTPLIDANGKPIPYTGDFTE